MDDMDVTRSMSASAGREFEALPFMLTVPEAAKLLGIRRTLAYKLLRRFIETGGAEGIPVIRIGRCWRVPRDELLRRIRLGCISGSSGVVADELASRRRPSAEGAGEPNGVRRRVHVRRGGQAAVARARRPRREPPEQLPLFPAV